MGWVLIDENQKPYWGEDEGYIAIKFTSQNKAIWVRKYELPDLLDELNRVLPKIGLEEQS